MCGNIKIIYFAGAMLFGVNFCALGAGITGKEHIMSKDNPKVTAGDSVTVEFLTLQSAMYLVNEGVLHAKVVDVTGNYQIEIENFGDMNLGTLDAPAGASVVQLITSPDSVREIGDINLDILVHDANGISLNELHAVSDGAANITLQNVRLHMTTPVEFSNINVIFKDRVHIVLDYVDGMINAPIFYGVGDTSPLIITAKDINPMFSLEPYTDMGTVYVRVVRESDYTRFMNGVTGEFLNSLRGVSGASEFMARMDAASTMDEINHVMKQSVYTNPILLMRGVRAMNANMMFNLPDFSDDAIYVRPFTTFGDNGNAYGARSWVNIKFGNNLSIGAHVNAAYMDWNDDINDFSSNSFGGGVNLNWDDGRIVGRGVIGAGLSVFDVDAVYDDGKIYDAPIGYSIYAAGDIGTRFNLSDEFAIIPFVGVTVDNNEIAASSESNFDTNVGTDIGLNGAAYDVHYWYSLRTRVSASGAFGIGGRIALSSDVDGVGGDISFMRVSDNDVTFNELSLMLRMSF